MEIFKSVKSGPVEIQVRKYSDGRYGYDWEESGKRKQGRWRKSKNAVEEALKRAKVIAAGRINLLEVDPAELAEFRAWKASRSKGKSVAEIRDELLALKREDVGIDPHYVDGLAGPWEKFCDSFGKRQIGEVEPGDIETWLRELDKAARTRNNIRDIIVRLFRFAREREYLPDALTAAEKVKRIRIKARADDIEVWTPEEMKKMIALASAELLPWVAIGGFAGVRTEEIRPKTASRKDGLRWEDFRWNEKQIVLRAETSKVDRPRYIPISDNLAEWLWPHRDDTGPVVALASRAFYGGVERLKKAMGATGTAKKNALRHSFGSYRNAIIRNIGQLAEEMGNSPGIARRNYERPQPPAAAKEWFGILPG